jgi:hypothetical protein
MPHSRRETNSRGLSKGQYRRPGTRQCIQDGLRPGLIHKAEPRLEGAFGASKKWPLRKNSIAANVVD